MSAHNFVDLTGQRFYRLLVLKRAENAIMSNGKQKAQFLVKCDCGTVKTVRGADLKQGRQHSCGCKNSERTAQFNRLTKTKAAYDTWNTVWQAYKRGAKIRGLEFKLSKEQFLEITQKNCYYCDVEPKQKRKPRVKDKTTNFVYNGIDRVDSKKGYLIENVVPCCKWCNLAKGTDTQENFIKRSIKIAERFKND